MIDLRCSFPSGSCREKRPGEESPQPSGLFQKCLRLHQVCRDKPQTPRIEFGSSMGLPKKAKGSSKNKSKGGKEKGGKPKEPIKPQITVSDALQVEVLC